MGINLSKTISIFVENMSVELNSTNPGSTLNNKHVALSCYFDREHVENNVVDVMKIHTGKNFADPLTKHLLRNDFHRFYHECMVNG